MMRAILLAALAALSTGANPATYTVAPGGNDGNPGTAAAPFRTVAKGVSVARAGDTVQVRGGTYNESVTINQSGTASSPIKLQAYPGETPVLDGQNKIPGQWYGLIYVNGAYVEVSGFELKNSAQRGLVLYGHHGSAKQMNVHDSRENGVLIEGDDCLVEDSRVWRNALSNLNGAGGGMWSGGLNAARGADGIASRNVLRRNVVYQNWGEGLSTFEADGTVIEDNVIYDNFSVNLYVSDTRNAVVQRNIVYNTDAGPRRGGNLANGVALWDEVASKPRSSGNRIINNLVLGTFGVHTWDGVSSFTDNSLVAHNTVVGNAIGVGANGKGNRIVNNLNNAQVVGGSVIDAGYFRLKAASPVTPIAEVTNDFFNTARPNPATAGAIEFATVAVEPPTPPPPPPSANIAIGKPVMASSVERAGLEARFAVDSDPKTRWSSLFADPQWIEVDFQGIYNLTAVTLRWETAKSAVFKLLTSIDRVNWITLHDAGNPTADTVTIPVNGAGRYLRLFSTQRATPWGVSLLEIEATGTPYPCQ